MISRGRKGVLLAVSWLVAFGLGGFGAHLEAQAPPSPGSPQDPLVTASYVAQAIARAHFVGGQLVSVSADQSLDLFQGSELVLVSGAALAPSTSQLIDVTAGRPVGGSAGLSLDHLNLALTAQTITAGPAGATVYTNAPLAASSSAAATLLPRQAGQ